MRVLRGAVHVLGELCITLGVVLLLFVAWQLWWTDVVSGRTQARTAQALERQWDPPPRSGRGASPAPAQPVGGEQVSGPATGTPFALIRVPRWGSDYVRPILQGTDLSVLDEGVGHYPASVGPGAVGNFALAGHRVTYAKPFNRIAELRAGDPIVIETRTTWYVYRVIGHTIVTPDRVDVVAPVPQRPGVAPTERLMTMTACHPEFSARERYVLFSRLAQTYPRSAGTRPPELTAAVS